MLKIKNWYINFIEKKERNLLEQILYFILWLFSFIYGIIVYSNNFLYDKRIRRAYRGEKKVISLGNLSWAGSGKTTLAIYLYKKLANKYKIAVLRRGYGADEEQLLKEKGIIVFSSPNRSKIIEQTQNNFDVFLLDDGFQHRKLYRDIDIVIMGTRELKNKWQLIPAYFFREPLRALKRADILIINYKEEIEDIFKTKNMIQSKFNNLSIYSATYKFKRITDLKENEVSLEYFSGKKIAGLAAIGYPLGFFNQVARAGICLAKTITYPDHYEFSQNEFENFQEKLISDGITDVILTQKDKYHIPKINLKLKFHIFEVEMLIDEEKRFIEEILTKLK